MPTLFSRIIAGEIPAEFVYEDEWVVAFRDINPVAPTHILIVPRQEVSGLAAVEGGDGHEHILRAARQIAEEQGLEMGYRLVINQGADGGQTVDHLHAHLIGGRPLSWPPG